MDPSASPRSLMKTSVSSSIKRTSPAKTRASLIPQDKGAVILEIGHAYTRIGMSGEPSPRHIIKSTVSMRPYGEVLNVWDQKYISRNELYLIMCRFLSDVYLKYLLINPRDHRVVIVESLFSPSHFRNTIAKALFHHFQVPNVCFFPFHLSCLFTLGKSTALLVDIGYKETSVLPVYEGVAVINGWQVTGAATESFHKNLTALLKEKGSVKNVNTGLTVSTDECKELSYSDDTISNIAIRTCFVRPLSRKDQVPLDVSYPVNPTHTLNITGHVRCYASDSFFECAEDLSIQECILKSLLQCSIDTRRELAENILVIGGGACLPGFNWRLKEEIEKLLTDNAKEYESLKALKFKFHKPISNSNYTAWQGGSIFGSFEMAVLERSVSRETFKEKNQLPEWMSCDPTQRERIQVVPTRKLPLSGTGSGYSLPSSSRRDLPTITTTKTIPSQK